MSFLTDNPTTNHTNHMSTKAKPAEIVDHVYSVVRTVHRQSDGKSWRRLNAALHRVLEACIQCGMKFPADTFDKIAALGGGYWMGNSYGSRLGEGYYTDACNFRNESAAKSFEKWKSCGPVLWDGETKKAERMYVGAEVRLGNEIWKVANVHYDRVNFLHRDGRRKTLTVEKIKEMRAERSQWRAALKREIKKARKAHAPGSPEMGEFLGVVRAKITDRREAGLLQHWEIEELQQAAGGLRIPEMRKQGVTLRVHGSEVRASNGQAVPLDEVILVLPRILRALDGDVNELRTLSHLHRHPVTIKPDGVQVGCTFVPREEVIRIGKALIA